VRACSIYGVYTDSDNVQTVRRYDLSPDSCAIGKVAAQARRMQEIKTTRGTTSGWSFARADMRMAARLATA
ncbi:MAG TPA: hypothetical protein VF035_02195, partial [Longimicrobiales bacterium]